MATFVLVGGAWLGGWAWHRVAQQLRSLGNEVYPATLTGLGERAHLARPDVDLETHIADVVNLMVWEDLRDAVLVGHSYAGIVVSGVADRAGDRLRQLVYCDSAPFLDGESFLGISPPDAQQATLRDAEERGDGWRLPYPGAEELARQSSLRGLTPEDLATFEARAVGQPLRTYTQPLSLRSPGSEPAYGRVAIACDNLRGLIGAGIPRMVDMTKAPWRYQDLDTGHWPMLSTPKELAEALDEVGR